MTHLLPGGGVPGVHGARSPVPPRLPLLTTPWSVHHLAAVAAGAYPPRRPPNARSPGVPAAPGPCYWLVASWTPLGWREGCLAVGLVRGAVRHQCLGGCSALVVCARCSRPVRGGCSRCQVCVFPTSPFPPRVSRAVCGGQSCPAVPYPPSLVHHSMRSVLSACLVRLPSWYSPRVLCGCVRSRSRGVRASPFPGSVWRAHLARSRCWAPVGPFHAVRAPPRVLPRSRSPFGLLGGGGGGSLVPFPSCLVWGCVPPLGGARASGAFRHRGGRGGGGVCAFLPGGAAGGPRGAGGRPTSVRPSAFPGQATKRVSLASLRSWRVWPPYCSGSCSRVVSGRGPCGVLVRWRGFACLSRPPCEQAVRGVGARGVRPQLGPPSGAAALLGEGTPPLPTGGWRAGAPVACGPEGGSGGRGEGGSLAGSAPPSSGGSAWRPRPRPPFLASASPPGILVRPGSLGSPGRRARPGQPPVGQPRRPGGRRPVCRPPRRCGRGA